MIKKIAILFILASLVSCTSVKEKASGIKEMGNIGKNCPPKEEKTLKHIFCKEPK